ncbi:hypothetical protein A6R68_22657, partial [Neotoma lepida]
AIQKGNTEVARIHAENAIRQKNQAINFLRMSARVDAVAARVQTAVTMGKVTKSMAGVVKSMDATLRSMNLEKNQVDMLLQEMADEAGMNCHRGLLVFVIKCNLNIWCFCFLHAIGHVKMKLNVSILATSCQKLMEVDREHKHCAFYEKCMAKEVAADALGDENDKQGFLMRQDILTYASVLLLLSKYTFSSDVTDDVDGLRRKIVLTYVALVIHIIIGEFHSIKGDDLTHPGISRGRGVRMDVESGRDARMRCLKISTNDKRARSKWNETEG